MGAVDERLGRFGDHLRALGKQSHHSREEYGRAVRLFVELIDAGETVYPGEVRQWALDDGWTEADAHDLATLAEAVTDVMRLLRQRDRLR